MIRPMLSASMTTLVKYSVASTKSTQGLRQIECWQEMEKNLTVCWRFFFQKKGLQIKRNWSKPSHLSQRSVL